jgi:hypothetical protein
MKDQYPMEIHQRQFHTHGVLLFLTNPQPDLTVLKFMEGRP